MPQNPITIPTINLTNGLPAADTPLDSALQIEVQSGGHRMKATIADVVGGGGGVAGGGTTNRIPKWASSDTVSNSIMSDDGSTLTVSGGQVVTGNETINGNAVVSGGATVSGTAHVVGAATLDALVTFGSFAKLHQYTLAQANAATPAEGDLCIVTDSSVTTWGAIVVATGTDDVVAWYDGTNWSVIGKVGA